MKKSFKASKNEKIIFNPHDNFFAEAIKNKEVAKAFFKAYIPESFKKDMDFDSIELEKIIKDIQLLAQKMVKTL